MSESHDQPSGRHHEPDVSVSRVHPMALVLAMRGRGARTAALGGVVAALLVAGAVVGLRGLDHPSRAAAAGSTAAGPGPASGGGPGSGTGSVAALSGPTTTTTPATPAPATTGTGPAACTLAQLTISVSNVDRADAGMGHSSSALLFRNVGATTCRLRGYPTVAALDAHGRTVETAAASLRGYMGGLDPSATKPPTVNLAPGQAASALVEALNANPDGRACRPFPALRVTPPGVTGSHTVGWGAASGCAHLEVHPFVPGASGRMA
jgi:hypothetical protein